MKNYETVFILNPVLSEDQAKDAVEKFVKVLGQKANIVNVENGLEKLAYPIQHKSTGFNLDRIRGRKQRSGSSGNRVQTRRVCYALLNRAWQARHFAYNAADARANSTRTKTKNNHQTRGRDREWVYRTNQ